MLHQGAGGPSILTSQPASFQRESGEIGRLRAHNADTNVLGPLSQTQQVFELDPQLFYLFPVPTPFALLANSFPLLLISLKSLFLRRSKERKDSEPKTVGRSRETGRPRLARQRQDRRSWTGLSTGEEGWSPEQGRLSSFPGPGRRGRKTSWLGLWRFLPASPPIPPTSVGSSRPLPRRPQCPPWPKPTTTSSSCC